MGSDFPPTSGQIPPTSGASDWPNSDPHMVYPTPIAYWEKLLKVFPFSVSMARVVNVKTLKKEKNNCQFFFFFKNQIFIQKLKKKIDFSGPFYPSTPGLKLCCH